MLTLLRDVITSTVHAVFLCILHESSDTSPYLRLHDRALMQLLPFSHEYSEMATQEHLYFTRFEFFCPFMSWSLSWWHFNPCMYLSRYRARVEKAESAAKVHVFYIDYGNVSNNELVFVCVSEWWIHSYYNTRFSFFLIQFYSCNNPKVSHIYLHVWLMLYN